MIKAEKVVERYLVKQVEKLGGKCWKWRAIDNRGVPDRIAVIPEFGLMAIEVKRSNGKLTALQSHVLNFIKNCSGACCTVYGKAGVDALIKTFQDLQKKPNGVNLP